MPLYKNAYYWLIALFVLLVLGFWKSYFLQLGDNGLVAGFFCLVSIKYGLIKHHKLTIFRSLHNE